MSVRPQFFRSVNTFNQNSFVPAAQSDRHLRLRPASLKRSSYSERKTFGFGQPQAEQFLLAFEIHADRHVNRMRRNAAIRAANMHDDAIEVHDRKDRIEQPRTPRRDLVVDGRRGFRNQRRLDFRTRQVFENLLHLASAQPFGEERDDLLIEATEPPLMLVNEQWLECAQPI